MAEGYPLKNAQTVFPAWSNVNDNLETETCALCFFGAATALGVVKGSFF